MKSPRWIDFARSRFASCSRWVIKLAPATEERFFDCVAGHRARAGPEAKTSALSAQNDVLMGAVSFFIRVCDSSRRPRTADSRLVDERADDFRARHSADQGGF